MFQKKNTGFCKSVDCPSSSDLLDFQKNELPSAHKTSILDHLESCEFCSAELAFYSHYPQEEGAADPSDLGDIPLPLYELAEALLKKYHADASSLDALLKLKEGTVIEKV